MIEPLSALAYLATSALNFFTRNQQTEQTSLSLRTRQEHEQSLRAIHQQQLKLDADKVNLQKMSLVGQVKQIENQRAQIEIAEGQLRLQLQEVENQARSLSVQGEMLKVLNLQKVLLLLISFVALVWLGIQVFPVVSPWLRVAFIFILEEVNFLKNSLLSLLDILSQSISQILANIFKIMVEVTSSMKTWFDSSLPLLLNQIFQMIAQFWFMLSESFSDVFFFLKNLISDMTGLTGSLIAVVICGLCPLSLK